MIDRQLPWLFTGSWGHRKGKLEGNRWGDVFLSVCECKDLGTGCFNDSVPGVVIESLTGDSLRDEKDVRVRVLCLEFSRDGTAFCGNKIAIIGRHCGNWQQGSWQLRFKF